MALQTGITNQVSVWCETFSYIVDILDFLEIGRKIDSSSSTEKKLLH
jgi:hypothetical protein